MEAPILFWFRRDLRLMDNPALLTASQQGRVLPIFIFDDDGCAGDSAMGAASRCWLHHSLAELNRSLGGKLQLFVGEATDVINGLIEQLSIEQIYWNRCYEPWQVERDRKLKAALIEKGLTVQTFNGALLWEPWTVFKKDKTPYKVFTPFFKRGCMAADAPRRPLAAPDALDLCDKQCEPAVTLADLKLLPDHHWGKALCEQWEIGEAAAQRRLAYFFENLYGRYAKGRDFPSEAVNSRLAAHFHFGELSPNQAWYRAVDQDIDPREDDYCIELGWREFSYSLLFYNNQLQSRNLQEKFDRFPWEFDDAHFSAWKRGLTGYPIVDAGMRELYQTGTMHNRVRMIVGSFLVKNLLIHWTHGERWFWDTLFDADCASNSAGWQWVAGTGADAAPYFRIFNPITQGEKFDKQGHYTRKYVPELSKLPDKYLFSPWTAPQSVLSDAGVTLGLTYPRPVVELKRSRNRALHAYELIKGGL